MVGGRICLPHPRRGSCLDGGNPSPRSSTPVPRQLGSSRYKGFAKIPQTSSPERLLTLRGLFPDRRTAEDEKRKPVPLDQVEPAKDIVKAFSPPVR